MKKLLLSFALLLLIKASSLAQVAIPMPNFGFSDGTGNYPNCAIPSGFTANLSASAGVIYTNSGSGGVNFPALKLQNTPGNPNGNEYAQIQTATSPGPVTYSIRGNSSNASWDGTFEVLQSVDGIDFTTLAVLKSYSGVNALPKTGNFVVETVTPDPTARYIRWFFTNKVSGSNVALDDISIAAPAVNAGPNLVVTYASNTLIDNQTINFSSAIGVPVTISVVIKNYANTNDLIIDANTAIAGSFASDYAISTALPLTVAASTGGTTTQNLDFVFTPQANGNRFAVLTIHTNDPNFSTFTIQLNGVGGTIASEPITTLSALSFSGTNNFNKSYRLKGSFSSSGSADGYLVIRRIGSAPATAPTDGKEYLRGDTVGADKVLGSFSTTDIVANNTIAGTNYYFAVYAYNGNGTFRNYAQSAPLISNVTSSLSMMPANEYASINTSNPSFISDLTSVIDVPGRTKIYYSNYGGTMMKLFAATDTFAGKKVATCVYSGDKFIYNEPIAWGYMSREHSYCHNWMPTNPADGSAGAPNNVERPEYNDQHHLFPTNQDDVNALRSNFPLGKVVSNATSFLDGKSGDDINGKKVYEPRDGQKGRSARAIMYMAVAHNNLNDAFGNPQNWKLRNPISGSITYGQDQNVLKKWNEDFPPDNWDISRNDFLDSLQGNRNPFVDHPEYACFIDFSNMTYIANAASPCSNTGVSPISSFVSNLYLAPNPSQDNFTLYFDANYKQTCLYQLFDITGKVIESKNITTQKGSNQFLFDISILDKGIYQVQLSGNDINYTQKIVKQ